MRKSNWYQLEVKEVFEKLHTSEHGLSWQEVEKRLRHYGPNKLAEEDKISKLQILLHQFTSPLIYILLVAGIVTIILQEYIDSGVIFSVISRISCSSFHSGNTHTGMD